MVAEADLVVSATEVAVIVTLRLLAGGAGALYVTDVGAMLVSVPAPVAEEMVHVTPPPLGSLLTVAAIGCAPPARTVAVVGPIETAIAGTVMVEEADLVASATEVAVMVVVRLLDKGSGAV
jgi:hypothetical protein